MYNISSSLISTEIVMSFEFIRDSYEKMQARSADLFEII